MRESQTNPTSLTGDLLLQLGQDGTGPCTSARPAYGDQGGADPSGVAAGLHLILRLPAGVGTGAVVTAAAARSLLLTDLAGYHATEDHADHGLVLGYGNLADGMVEEAVRRLREAIVDASR